MGKTGHFESPVYTNFTTLALIFAGLISTYSTLFGLKVGTKVGTL